MKWRTEKTPLVVLVFLTGLAVLAMGVAERSTLLIRQPHYDEKLRAAKTMLLAMNTIKNEALANGLVIDPVNDPNATGLIGGEFSLITTDRGDLAAKLTTTNPNFSAAVVEMLAKAKLKKGDAVAVGMTGSFPALNIAVLAALDALDLKPIVVSSVGSSSWGANDPRMVWLDMERILSEKGVLRFRSAAASIGGGKDIGRGLSPEGRDLILKAIHRNGVPNLTNPMLEEGVQVRMKFYDKAARGKKIKAYINIGGGVASLGSPVNGDLFPFGLSQNAGFRNFPSKGVMILMAERGIPIIHLLNIPEIARRYGLPLAPAPLPDLGQGPIYFKEHYDRLRLVLITLGLLAATVVAVRINLFHYLAQLRQARLRGANSGSSVLPPTDRKSEPGGPVSSEERKP